MSAELAEEYGQLQELVRSLSTANRTAGFLLCFYNRSSVISEAASGPPQRLDEGLPRGISGTGVTTISVGKGAI